MNTPKEFLTRWSRRKRAAAQAEEAKSRETPPPAASGEAVGTEGLAAEGSVGDGPASPRVPPTPVGPSFDPAGVPPIESIAADTDIRAFLAPGVPPELTRAALRRAWAADPSIRDFVGLADYDWDFNTPGSMAGFGALEMTDELRRVVAQIIGPAPAQDQAAGILKQASVESASGGNTDEPALVRQGSAEREDHVALAQNIPTEQPPAPSEGDDLVHRGATDAAAQSPPRTAEKSHSIVRHSHGGALPK
jgi:Protein of unknown function (DUF3306)